MILKLCVYNIAHPIVNEVIKTFMFNSSGSVSWISKCFGVHCKDCDVVEHYYSETAVG